MHMVSADLQGCNIVSVMAIGQFQIAIAIDINSIVKRPLSHRLVNLALLQRFQFSTPIWIQIGWVFGIFIRGYIQ